MAINDPTHAIRGPWTCSTAPVNTWTFPVVYPPWKSWNDPAPRKIKRVEYHENGNAKLVEYED